MPWVRRLDVNGVGGTVATRDRGSARRIFERRPLLATFFGDPKSVRHNTTYFEGILANVYLFITERKRACEDQATEIQEALLYTKYHEAMDLLLKQLQRTFMSPHFRLDHWIRDIFAVADALEEADLYCPFDQR